MSPQLKLIALDADDLAVISAHVQDARVRASDIIWRAREKRLVIGGGLVVEIARLLRDGGELFVQTDVEERAAMYEEEIARAPELVPAGDAAGSPRLAENPYGARSPREHRAIADGLPVNRLRYRRLGRMT